jgi:hypothetical protein
MSMSLALLEPYFVLAYFIPDDLPLLAATRLCYAHVGRWVHCVLSHRWLVFDDPTAAPLASICWMNAVKLAHAVLLRTSIITRMTIA